MVPARFWHRLRSLFLRLSRLADIHVRVPLLFIATVRNWPRYFGKQPGESVTYALRNGLRLTAPAGTSDIHPFADIWLRRVYDVRGVSWEGVRTVIDGGAHVGAFTLLAAHRAPEARIVAFEPDPLNLGFLRRNIEQNGLGQRVTVLPTGIAAAEGEATLNVVPGGGEKNSVYDISPEGVGTTVRMARLQDAFDREGIDYCDILKLNVEGSEYEILYGLPESYLRRIGAIVMNYHLFVPGENANPDALRSYLGSHGFLVREQGKRIFGAMRLGDPRYASLGR